MLRSANCCQITLGERSGESSGDRNYFLSGSNLRDAHGRDAGHAYFRQAVDDWPKLRCCGMEFWSEWCMGQ